MGKKELTTPNRQEMNKVKRVTPLFLFFNLCVCVCVFEHTYQKKFVRKALPLLRLWDEFSNRGGRKIDT